MRKWILIIFSLLFWNHSIAAQDRVGCTQLLEDAREAYSAGMVELVPELLLPCLESGGLEGTPRQDAYKLVINAYLFDYLPEEADSLMNDFITDFPDYRAEADDPAEFVQLLEANLRARGVDPNRVVIRDNQVTDRTGEQRTGPPDARTRLKPPFIYGNSMGFTVGLNGTFPQIIERYSMGDPSLDQGTFGILPGYQAGIVMNLRLSQGIEASFGLQYNRTRFSFEASPFSFASYVYEEYQSHLQLPASILFKLNPESTGTSVYLKIGAMADYLLAAAGAGTRSYSESLRDVVIEKMDITDSRARINVHGIAGFGVRIPFERAFMFLEANFSSGILLTNKEESRFENQDLTWLLYHVDSDFRSHQANFSIGMAWNL